MIYEGQTLHIRINLLKLVTVTYIHTEGSIKLMDEEHTPINLGVLLTRLKTVHYAWMNHR